MNWTLYVYCCLLTRCVAHQKPMISLLIDDFSNETANQVKAQSHSIAFNRIQSIRFTFSLNQKRKFSTCHGARISRSFDSVIHCFVQKIIILMKTKTICLLVKECKTWGFMLFHRGREKDKSKKVITIQFFSFRYLVWFFVFNLKHTYLLQAKQNQNMSKNQMEQNWIRIKCDYLKCQGQILSLLDSVC